MVVRIECGSGSLLLCPINRQPMDQFPESFEHDIRDLDWCEHRVYLRGKAPRLDRERYGKHRVARAWDTRA